MKKDIPISGGSGDSNRRRLAEALHRELFVAAPLPDPAKELPFPETDALAIIQGARERYAQSERWPMRAANGGSNPLAAAIQGNDTPVQVFRPDGRLAMEASLGAHWVTPASATPASHHDQTELDTIPGLRGDSGDDDSEFSPLGADLALSAASDDEDEDLDLWDQVEELTAASVGASHEPDRLWLTCPELPDNWTLGDVVIYSHEDSEPLTVLTVRRVDRGYELSFDPDDLGLLSCDTACVDLRLLPVKGA